MERAFTAGEAKKPIGASGLLKCYQALFDLHAQKPWAQQPVHFQHTMKHQDVRPYPLTLHAKQQAAQ